MWFEQMHPNWQVALQQQKPLLERLEVQLADLPNLVPNATDVMRAFRADPENIKVILLGQDPYPTQGVANGLAFAVRSPKNPASLKNLALELHNDLQLELKDSELRNWVSQGVLLLNTCLTALEGNSNAHSRLGWQEFTSSAVAYLIKTQPVVFLVFGTAALKVVRELGIDADRVVYSVHPSPLSAYRGFFGSKPFSRVNAVLVKLKLTPIDW